MAFTTINDSEAFFKPVLYTGNDTARTITTGLDTDFVWIKVRSSAGTENHVLNDSVAGATKWLSTNLTAAEQTNADTLTSFTSTGFTLGDDNGGYGFNDNTEDYISWNWRLGTTSGISAGAQTITPTGYSINTTSGMGIYEYAGGGGVDTISHGLGVAPVCWFTKSTSAVGGWSLAHHWLNEGTTPFEYTLHPDTDAADAADTTWGDTAPTSSLFTLGNTSTTNNSGKDYKITVMTPIKGYSHFGYYDGNANADGPCIFTGFSPALVILKDTDSTGEWCMYTSIDGTLSTNSYIYTNLSYAEGCCIPVDFLSTGFKIKTSNNDRNQSGSHFVYMAWARTPFVNSEGVPANAVASTF